MLFQLQNECLTVCVNSKGGSLWSVEDCEQTQYLWQGDSRYWADRAPNLFPYIARLTEGKYILNHKTYEMDIHGFIKDSELLPAEEGADILRLVLNADEATKKQYPYDFVYEILYELKNHTIHITYRVTNHDSQIMYFGIGGHPGFMVPLEKELAFEDYYLEFQSGDGAQRVGMSEDCFVTGENREFVLEQGKLLHLRHDLFDDDAIILCNMAHEVTLKSDKGRKAVRVAYPQMNYLGLWHWPHTDAPYLCIEPWTSLPSRKGIVEDISLQDNLIILEPGKSYSNHWEIEFIQN